MALGGHQTHAHCLHAVPQLIGFMTKRRGDRTRDLLTDWSLGPNPLSSSSLDNLDPHMLVKRKGRRDPTQMEGLIVQNLQATAAYRAGQGQLQSEHLPSCDYSCLPHQVPKQNCYRKEKSFPEYPVGDP